MVPYLRVKKTSLYLPDEVDRALTRRAAEEGITKAQLIRLALQREVKASDRPRAGGAGAFAGPGDLSVRVDEHLAESGFGR